MRECVIIGGGAAGLVAATYLARYRRDFVLIDAGESRLQRIPRTRNTPGFPDGVTGKELLRRLSQQARNNGAHLIEGRVTGIERATNGFAVMTNAGVHQTKTVLIATGVVLVEPEIDALDDALERGIVRYCPICDGFEAQGQSIAVLGGDAHGLNEARFLTRYSDRVTFIPATSAARLNSKQQTLAEAQGIAWASDAPSAIRVVRERICVEFGEQRKFFDTLYPALGCAPQSGLALALGAGVGAMGGLLTDHHQRTRIPGVYGAGDVVEGLDQIAAAFGHAAIAATTIHNDLTEAASAGR